MDNKDEVWLVRYVYKKSNVVTLVLAPDSESAIAKANAEIFLELGIFPEEAREVTATLQGTFTY